jgi:hypothetical protein
MQDRIDIAIEFMKDGKSFRVGDLMLGAGNSNEIEISGWSNYSSIKNITEDIARKELDEIKGIFSSMLSASSKLRDFTSEKKLKFILYYDDGGKGSIVICTEEDGYLQWIMHLQRG